MTPANWNQMAVRRFALLLALTGAFLAASFVILGMGTAAETEDTFPVVVEETVTVTAAPGAEVCVEASGTVGTSGPVCTPGEVSATVSVRATADADVTVTPRVHPGPYGGSACLTADIELASGGAAEVVVTADGQELLSRTVTADAAVNESATVCAQATLG